MKDKKEIEAVSVSFLMDDNLLDEDLVWKVIFKENLLSGPIYFKSAIDIKQFNHKFDYCRENFGQKFEIIAEIVNYKLGMVIFQDIKVAIDSIPILDN